jgi:hypothetical protein
LIYTKTSIYLETNYLNVLEENSEKYCYYDKNLYSYDELSQLLQICLYPSDITYIFMRYVEIFLLLLKEKKLLKKVISIEF